MPSAGSEVSCGVTSPRAPGGPQGGTGLGTLAPWGRLVVHATFLPSLADQPQRSGDTPASGQMGSRGQG